MLTDEEIKSLIAHIKKNEMNMVVYLLIKKVFDNYKMTKYKGKNIDEFSKDITALFFSVIGDKWPEKTDEELTKILNSLLRLIMELVQRPHLNE